MPDLAAKPSALFLTAESPYPMVGGGALRSASVLGYLLQKYETDVICFRQPEAAPVDWPAIAALQNVRSWREIVLPVHGRSALERSLRNARRAVNGVPPLVDRFAGFSGQVGEALGAERYDVAVVEHFWCATYAPQLRPHCGRLVLDLHNLESLWHERCARVLNPLVAPIHHAFARAAARMERELLPQFDLILATSKQECHSVADRFPALRTTVVPNTLQWRERPSLRKEPSIVFSGNMDYLPNQKAVRHFARAIWPEVRRHNPGLHWKILGKAAAKVLPLVGSTSNVTILSDPEDAMIEIARSQAAVVPLTTGTGTRLKIIEAWSAGCPVVSTPIGAEGLDYQDGVNILIEESAKRFAQAVLRVVEDRSLAESLANAGRSRFEESYSWNSAWAALRICGL